uniref:Uncharacterized protein n=1 Tax=Leersia perrieri TaxID=77586 RepID=A0A0D9VKA2_9ORYZ
MNQTTVEMPLPTVDAASVLGRDQDKNKIITKLIESKDQQEIEIVSVIGLGGSGKTTLAKLVFNDGDIIEKYFEVRLWVQVAKEFVVTRLFEKLFEAVTKEKSARHTFEHMREKISKEVNDKRVLLILDDVWTEERIQWEQFRREFMVHLKNGKHGSRILLTTRSKRVAEAAESTSLFDLPFLSLDDSWQLFDRTFRGVKRLGSEFEQVGKEIVKKCGGVPLAIIVVAGVLRDKELIGEWKAMRDNNILDVKGEESISACLKLSYFHLPSHLKQCFTLCSLYPKGNWVSKDQLIDQWIAHDMIDLAPGVEYLEHIGHKYFNSLVQMSFLQDVDVDRYGMVICRMHDLVHDLARFILHEEISIIVPEDASSSTKGSRYISLVEQPRNILPDFFFEKARALYVDKGDHQIFGKALKSAKHLRSIAVESICTAAVPTTIFQVKSLKHLEISEMECEALPEAISDIWSLQSLYVTSEDLIKLPKFIGKLKKLRTLKLLRCRKLKSLPDSIGDCHLISTLDLSGCNKLKELPNSISKNRRLRVLSLRYTRIERLPSSIITLKNLEYLDLQSCYWLTELPEGIGSLTKLQVLNLVDCIAVEAMPVGIGQLTQLEMLGLFHVGSGEKSARISELATIDRMSGELSITHLKHVTDPCEASKACLKQKKNLHELKLAWDGSDKVNIENELAVLDGLEPPLGIKYLEIYRYAGSQFAKWMQKQVDGGVHGLSQFPFLTNMMLNDLPNLKHLDGLVQLPSLGGLYLTDMPGLESISGGPFPSLEYLSMKNLATLGEVWMVTEKTLDGWVDGGGCNKPYHLRELQIGSRLRMLRIDGCPKLEVKPYLPSSLKRLYSKECNDQLLQSPCQRPSLSSSSPPSFSHLKKVVLWPTSSSISPPSHGLGSGRGWELIQHMSALESLEILFCDGLTELPKIFESLASLQSLRMCLCPAIRVLPESLGELRSLQELTIECCDNLSTLPHSMGHLTSLQKLRIEDCKALYQLPESLGELLALRELEIKCLNGLTRLPQSMGQLTLLQKLQITHCDSLHQLPESLGDLPALRKFHIRLKRLTCLPQSMFQLATSLKEIKIVCCEGMKSLPEGIQGLSTLQLLVIRGCPDLARRCYLGKGEDWHLISHVPYLTIERSEMPSWRVNASMPSPSQAP